VIFGIDVRTADGSRAGALVGVYLHLNNNVKLGCGFNCTDFLDDVTDLSYRSHGLLANLVSKF
jgi:hypothetical protein